MSTKTSYTSGPWESLDGAETEYLAGFVVIDNAGTLVADCFGGDPEIDGSRTDDENRANARLIAAAPELAEALLAALSALPDGPVERQARAALAKAGV